MNKDIEFFIYNYCIDFKKIHKNKMDETLKSFTHKLLERQKVPMACIFFVPQNACC